MRIVLTTVPVKKAERLLKQMVQERLAGCALDINLGSPSCFWWKGKLDREKESLLLFKTKKSLVKKLFKRLKEVHPYTVPFIAEIKVEGVHKPYYDWLKSVTK